MTTDMSENIFIFVSRCKLNGITFYSGKYKVVAHKYRLIYKNETYIQ